MLILLIVALLSWAVAMETIQVGDYVCRLHDGILWKGKAAPFNDIEQCTKEARVYLIVAWSVAVVSGVPLQIFAVTFFKAFRDNLQVEKKFFSPRQTSVPKKRDYESLSAFDPEEYRFVSERKHSRPSSAQKFQRIRVKKISSPR